MPARKAARVQFNVWLDVAVAEAIRKVVERERLTEPGYSPADLLRELIAESLMARGELTPKGETELPMAACVLIMHGDLVLGVSRRDKPNDWGMPGGKCEVGESPTAAAARELREETGFSVDESDLREAYRAEADSFLAITYLAKKYESPQELKGREGEGAVAWVSWDELFAGSFAAYNRGLKQAIDEAREFFSYVRSE